MSKMHPDSYIAGDGASKGLEMVPYAVGLFVNAPALRECGLRPLRAEVCAHRAGEITCEAHDGPQ